MLAKIYRLPRLAILFFLAVVFVIVAIILITRNIKFKNQVLRDETITIKLVSSIGSQQLIFENDTVSIESNCEQYLVFLDMKVADPSISETTRLNYEETRKNIDETNCHIEFPSLSEQIVADMLEQGVVCVYDKRSNTKIMTVTVRYYEFLCGPLCGQGSRSFYLPDDTLFLRIIDWMS
jgi:hypothetical protein